MAGLRRVGASIDDANDAELLTLVREGRTAATAELWRRHAAAGRTVARAWSSSADPDDLVSEAFLRVLGAVERGGGPEGAFRPYFFTSIRNVATSWARRGQHERPLDDGDRELAAEGPDPEEQALAALERDLGARAFKALPARWQEVLWYTEVEGLSPAQAAPLLGLRPNGVAALSLRAREGLRVAWIREHVVDSAASGECEWVLERAGAHTRGRLPARDRLRLNAHLMDCTSCEDALAEAESAGRRLATVLLPLAAGLGGAAAWAGGSAEPASAATASAPPGRGGSHGARANPGAGAGASAGAGVGAGAVATAAVAAGLVLVAVVGVAALLPTTPQVSVAVTEEAGTVGPDAEELDPEPEPGADAPSTDATSVSAPQTTDPAGAASKETAAAEAGGRSNAPSSAAGPSTAGSSEQQRSGGGTSVSAPFAASALPPTSALPPLPPAPSGPDGGSSGTGADSAPGAVPIAPDTTPVPSPRPSSRPPAVPTGPRPTTQPPAATPTPAPTAPPAQTTPKPTTPKPTTPKPTPTPSGPAATPTPTTPRPTGPTPTPQAPAPTAAPTPTPTPGPTAPTPTPAPPTTPPVPVPPTTPPAPPQNEPTTLILDTDGRLLPDASGTATPGSTVLLEDAETGRRYATATAEADGTWSARALPLPVGTTSVVARAGTASTPVEAELRAPSLLAPSSAPAGDVSVLVLTDGGAAGIEILVDGGTVLTDDSGAPITSASVPLGPGAHSLGVRYTSPDGRVGPVAESTITVG